MWFRAWRRSLAASFLLLACAAGAATDLEHTSEEQREADYRVVAARCGHPSFERAFFAQSGRLVAAGVIAPGRDPKLAERSITALRRNPLVLVANWSDCPAQLAQLQKLYRDRRIQVVKNAHRAALQ